MDILTFQVRDIQIDEERPARAIRLEPELQGVAARQIPLGYPADRTRDTRAFTAEIRTEIFTFLRAWSRGADEAALAVLADVEDPDTGQQWTAVRLRAAADAHRAGHGAMRFDPEARNLRHTYVTVADDGRTWRVEQMLIDADEHNDWVAAFAVDVAASREAERPVLRLLRLGPLAP